jgi:large subunit ribosomal protein L17
MRHRKRSAKLSRTTSHRRCLFANMLKALIFHEKILTTIPKAKELRRFADQMVSLAKQNTLASRRRAVGELMVRYNMLTPKERREAKGGDTSSYNVDRQVIEKLFGVLGPRFQERNGGYTRISRLPLNRTGDQGSQCYLEYLPG